MKSKLAVWYMEKAWPKMGVLRDVRAFHKLFNAAYSVRKQEYIDKILALPARVSTYQTERALTVRYLLELNGVQS